jgi:mRNA-degrading endonuclease RelE of RelBE toxin-antitoxin system
MAEYRVEVTEEARADLNHYPAFERKTITTAIREQLTHQPLVETRNRKPLRENPVAPWELRAGKFRVLYEVDECALVVTIVGVGHKEHGLLFIQGKEVKL